MKNEAEQSQSSIYEYYHRLVLNAEYLRGYIKKATDLEIIRLYNYVLKTAGELKDKPQMSQFEKTVLSYYYEASNVLEATRTIQALKNGEISLAELEEKEAKSFTVPEEEVVENEAEKQAQIDAIVDLLDQRRKAKTPLGRLRKMFSEKRKTK